MRVLNASQSAAVLGAFDAREHTMGAREVMLDYQALGSAQVIKKDCSDRPGTNGKTDRLGCDARAGLAVHRLSWSRVLA